MHKPDSAADPMLEEMSVFFTARLEGYDPHMLANVEGCKEAYPLLASLLPPESSRLLDLGCGTGLELDFIFQRFPAMQVTGIDLTEPMLEALRGKHPDKQLRLICGDYFSTDLGKGIFDCAVSVESLHHFAKERKLALYRRLFDALAPGGCYLECDYMVETQAEEDFFFAECARLRKAQGIPEETFIHYDTPCTVENQLTLLRRAGFSRVEHRFRKGATSVIVAQK